MTDDHPAWWPEINALASCLAAGLWTCAVLIESNSAGAKVALGTLGLLWCAAGVFAWLRGIPPRRSKQRTFRLWITVDLMVIFACGATLFRGDDVNDRRGALLRGCAALIVAICRCLNQKWPKRRQPIGATRPEWTL